MSEVRDILAMQGVTPSKLLGQNFLVDVNMAKWIVSQLEIDANDVVVEVGPGTGALTKHLVGLGKKTILVEFDARLAEYHRELWQDRSDVEVHHADGARWDVRELFVHDSVKWIGNLPYSSGGAIMQNFLQRPSPVKRAVLMLQKEFIERVIATSKDDAYGTLSLHIQAEWNATALRDVPPEAFHPRPKIDSTVMLLLPREAGELPRFDLRVFRELVKKAFLHRRKQMHRAMPVEPVWSEVCSRLGIDARVRAEQLSLQQWIELTNCYAPLGEDHSNAELLDEVDDADVVVGSHTRAEMHDKQLKHRAVHIFLINKHAQVLLQRRGFYKDRHPGKWDSSCAGHVDSGEDYLSAAKRELEEELGLLAQDLIEVAKLPPHEGNGQEFITLYVAKYTGKVDYNSAEVDSVQWFKPELVDSWLEHKPQDFAPAFAECWQRLRNL